MTKPFLCLLVALCLASCVTLEQAAPPAGKLVGGASNQELALGRELYVTRCAKCHSVEPVAKYSLDHWQKILPGMARKTHLSSNETEAVMRYITAVIKQPGSSS